MQPTIQPEFVYFAPAHAPKKKRNYVKVILFFWLLAFLMSLTALASASAFAPAAASSNLSVVATPTVADTFYIAKVNELRATKNLQPVRLLAELNQSSTDKAADMVRGHYWSHYAPNGGPAFSDFIWKRVPPATFVGENLARCYVSRDAAFAALVASPTHYEIMVGNFNYMGVSEAFDGDINCTITAMHFARI
jgi:uncharacterized protein YkwD